MLLIIVTILLALLLLGGRLFGLENFIVLTGSMEPVYHIGSMVYVKPAAADELEVGDAITFRLDEGTAATHRIVEIIDNEGAVQYRTKGDANETVDGRLISESDVIGKVVFTIPYIGYLASFIQTGAGRAAAVAYGAFILLMMILSELIFGEDKNK